MGLDREHIAELICQGIIVDDNNKVLPDKIEPDVAAQAPGCAGTLTGMLPQLALDMLMVIARRDESGGDTMGIVSRTMTNLIFG